MNNSVLNRIRVTRNGKLIRRKMGLGHCRAKKSANTMGRKYEAVQINKVDNKTFVKGYGLKP